MLGLTVVVAELQRPGGKPKQSLAQLPLLFEPLVCSPVLSARLSCLFVSFIAFLWAACESCPCLCSLWTPLGLCLDSGVPFSLLSGVSRAVKYVNEFLATALCTQVMDVLPVQPWHSDESPGMAWQTNLALLDSSQPLHPSFMHLPVQPGASQCSHLASSSAWTEVVFLDVPEIPLLIPAL